ncbi:MAG: transcriptional regulator [Planctomycetota bacterium]
MTKATGKTDNGAADEQGRFSYDGLERVIHEKARLGIMTSLVAHGEGLVFTDLKGLVGLTDGNLNRHLAVLEEAGLVESKTLVPDAKAKRGRGKRPTRYKLTRHGRERFLDYIGQLEQVVRDAGTASAGARGGKPARA